MQLAWRCVLCLYFHVEVDTESASFSSGPCHPFIQTAGYLIRRRIRPWNPTIPEARICVQDLDHKGESDWSQKRMPFNPGTVTLFP